MIDRAALLDDLKKQVKAVEADLGRQVRVVEEGARLGAEYERARELGRTAATWTSWPDERVTQVAVAWVLGTVFVRFCEDNRLIPEPYLTAPEEDRRDLALARYEAYVERDDNPTYRGWLLPAFAEIAADQAGRLLLDERHNPLYHPPLPRRRAGADRVLARAGRVGRPGPRLHRPAEGRQRRGCSPGSRARERVSGRTGPWRRASRPSRALPPRPAHPPAPPPHLRQVTSSWASWAPSTTPPSS